MIELLEAVPPKLGEPDTCAHSDDGLRDRFDEYPLDAWLCSRYLRGLADEALSEMRASYTAKLGRRDTSAPEATYVRVDGTLDIEKATKCVLDGDDFDAAVENLAGCAAWVRDLILEMDEECQLMTRRTVARRACTASSGDVT